MEMRLLVTESNVAEHLAEKASSLEYKLGPITAQYIEDCFNSRASTKQIVINLLNESGANACILAELILSGADEYDLEHYQDYVDDYFI